jgi:hypothetical protein
LVAGLLAAASPALGLRPPKSRYTTLDLSHCIDAISVSQGAWLKCEALPGYPVFVAEDDLRYFVSVGPDGEKRRAASQTLGAFNTLFRDKSTRTTLEWRFVIRNEKPVPYALILRYFTKSESRRGEVLVVTRVSQTEACHVAYIDAVANPSAIVLARQVADQRARKFNCDNEPARIGATGESPM